MSVIPLIGRQSLISERRRRLCREVMAGDNRVLHLLFALQQFPDMDDLLQFMSDKGIIGANVWEFYGECNYSPLRFASKLRKKMRKLMWTPYLKGDLI